jgi:hypothetical protein
MIKGFYKITSNGETIAEYQNMITANGLQAINEFLCGMASDWAGSIAVGSLNNNATASSTQFLDYEFIRYPVTLKSYFNNTSSGNYVALKTSLDPALIFQAYELGVFPNRPSITGNIDNFEISNFSEITSGSSLWYTASSTPATTASTSRINSLRINLPAGSSASSAIIVGLGSYSLNDKVDILYYTASQIVSTSSITVTFIDDSASANQWTASTTIPATASGTYTTSRLSFTSLPPDAFTYQTASCVINFSGTGTISLDHMKISTGGIKGIESILTSRVTASGSSPLINKAYGQPMEIEYYIQVT